MNARLIKKLPDWNGDARLYELNPPNGAILFVVVSAVNAMFSGQETYIFQSDSGGSVVDFTELDGSFRGSLDHAKALSGLGLGYQITNNPKDA